MTPIAKITVLTEALEAIYALPFKSIEADKIIVDAMEAIKPITQFPVLNDLDIRIFPDQNMIGISFNKNELTFLIDQAATNMIFRALNKGWTEIHKQKSTVIAATHIPPDLAKNRRSQ